MKITMLSASAESEKAIIDDNPGCKDYHLMSYYS